MKVFSGRKGLKVLLIRSGRMEPYAEVKALLPSDSTLDVLVSRGVHVDHPDICNVFEYPHNGLMLFHRIPAAMKKKLKTAYDLVIYINTIQSNMNFDNILTIGRNCGKRVFEYRPEQKLKEMKQKGIL